jgi:hypothetical protein
MYLNFIFFLIEYRKKGYKVEFFSLLILMEEKIGDHIRMLPKTWLEAAHLAKQCTRKLALRDMLCKL